MDPLYNNKGQLYAPYRFEQIEKEAYLISKAIHTSVTDIDNITPTERELLIKFIIEEEKAAKDKIKADKKAKNR